MSNLTSSNVLSWLVFVAVTSAWFKLTPKICLLTFWGSNIGQSKKMVILCVLQKKFWIFAKLIENLRVFNDLELALVEMEVEIRHNWGLKEDLRVHSFELYGSFWFIFGDFWLFWSIFGRLHILIRNDFRHVQHNFRHYLNLIYQTLCWFRPFFNEKVSTLYKNISKIIQIHNFYKYFRFLSKGTHYRNLLDLPDLYPTKIALSQKRTANFRLKVNSQRTTITKDFSVSSFRSKVSTKSVEFGHFL